MARHVSGRYLHCMELPRGATASNVIVVLVYARDSDHWRAVSDGQIHSVVIADIENSSKHASVLTGTKSNTKNCGSLQPKNLHTRSSPAGLNSFCTFPLRVLPIRAHCSAAVLQAASDSNNQAQTPSSTPPNPTHGSLTNVALRSSLLLSFRHLYFWIVYISKKKKQGDEERS